MTNLYNKLKNRTNSVLFIGLVLPLLLVNLPLLFGIVRPVHDTYSVFNVFYFVYNDFFFNNDLPAWQPFGSYGVHSYNQLINSLSPSHMFVGLIGWALGIKNTLFLFNLSLFLEQIIFLFGTYLLSKEIFRHKTTVAFVCLSTSLSTVLISQIWADFRVYSMLPLIIYFLVRFFSDKRLRHLGLSMVLFDISLLGNSAYLSLVVVLELLIIFLVLFFGNYKNWKDILTHSKKDIFPGIALFLVFIAVLIIYYYFMSHSMNLFEFLTPGRDPITGKTDIRTFLTYGGNINFSKFIEIIYPAGRFITSDNTLYIGLIPIVFLFYGLMRAKIPMSVVLTFITITFVLLSTKYSMITPLYSKLMPEIRYIFPMMALAFLIYIAVRTRNAVLTAFASVVAALGLFSLGEYTIIAETLYRYFPMMDYFRHIGCIVGSFNLFLPLLAGFGLDSFLSRLETGEASESNRKIILSAEIGISIIVIFGSLIYIFIANGEVPKILRPGDAVLYLSLTVMVLLFLFRLQRYISFRKHFRVFLISCVFFQMLSYQAIVNCKYYQMPEIMPLPEDAVLVSRYGFQEQRTWRPLTERSWTALASGPLPPFVNYTMSYNFIQWDPCVSALRTNSLNLNVSELLKLKGGRAGDMRYELPMDRNFLRSIGCESPKLKLMSNVVFLDSIENVKSFIWIIENIDEVLVLYNVPEDIRASWMKTPHKDTAGTIKVTGFSANRLDLDVNISGGWGSWLYYADAWHPRWKAFVNDKPVTIAQANLAFKAIKLDRGISKVRFVFEDRFLKTSSYFFIVLGIAFMVTILSGITLMVLRADKQP